MSKQLIDRIPFGKIVMVLAIIFGVSLGLCGVTVVFSLGGNSGGSFLSSFGILLLIAFGLSLGGLLLTLLVYVTLSIIGAFSGKVSQPQKLFDESDDTKIDKHE